VDLEDPESQVTSIDPGNIPDGLFWTFRVPDDSVDFNFGRGTASMSAADLELRDFHNLVNDFQHGPSVAAAATFTVRWNGAGRRFRLRDPDHGFEGEFRETTTTIDYSVSTEEGFEFVADPTTSHTVYAAIGHERNGVFFR
jgi:hypothetical protein